MNEFSDIANYLLKKGMDNRVKVLRKELEGRFIHDSEPINIEDLKPKVKEKNEKSVK